MFRRLSRFTLQYVSLTTFGTPVLFVSCSLGCPRKTVRCLVTHKNQWIFMIFQCLRGRRARRREDNRRENGTNNKRTKSDYTTSKLMFFGLPGAHLNDIAQYGLPELPGSLRGAAGVHSGRPKRAPRDAKGAPRRLQEPPRAPQKLPRGSPRAALAGTWGRPGPKEPPGGLQEAIFAPSGIDCWLLRGSIWVAPSAFWGALSTATKYRAYSPNWRPRRPGPRTAHRTPRTPPRMGSAAGA